MIIRGILQSVAHGIATLAGRPGEILKGRELMQQYGVVSQPLPGAECVVVKDGTMFVILGTEDRRYRVALESGEVALYDDLGQVIRLARDGIALTSPLAVTISAPTITATAETVITLDSPLVTCTGELIAAGNITDQGAATPKTMVGMRQIFNTHTHPHGQPTVPKPNEAM